MRILFSVLYTLLVLPAIYFGYRWFQSDGSAAVVFALLIGVLTILGVIQSIIVPKKSKGEVLDDNSRKNLLSIDIVTKKIRCYKENILYGIEIQLHLFASQKVSIIAISLSCQEVWTFPKERRQIAEVKILEKAKYNLLVEDFDKFQECISHIQETTTMPLIIQESEISLLTLVATLEGQRLQDSWEGIYLQNWRLLVKYNNCEMLEEFSMDIHEKSIQKPVQWEFAGFSKTSRS